MDKELPGRMQGKLQPPESAVNGLLARAGRAKKRSALPYVIAAAAAALALAMIPAALGWHGADKLHSVVDADSVNTQVTTDVLTTEEGVGDRDIDMTEAELVSAMVDAGFTQEDAEAFAKGHTVSWATWWIFAGGCETGERVPTIESLEAFLAERSAPKDGPIAPERPDQSGPLAAYEGLMRHIMEQDDLPGWYGGCFINDDNLLQIQLVEGTRSDGLELEIFGWTGRKYVTFGEVKYSLKYLTGLQEKVCALPEFREAGTSCCGVDQRNGILELAVSEATGELLRALYELDPSDDAIRVVTGTTVSAE